MGGAYVGRTKAVLSEERLPLKATADGHQEQVAPFLIRAPCIQRWAFRCHAESLMFCFRLSPLGRNN